MWTIDRTIDRTSVEIISACAWFAIAQPVKMILLRISACGEGRLWAIAYIKAGTTLRWLLRARNIPSMPPAHQRTPRMLAVN